MDVAEVKELLGTSSENEDVEELLMFDADFIEVVSQGIGQEIGKAGEAIQALCGKVDSSLINKCRSLTRSRGHVAHRKGRLAGHSCTRVLASLRDQLQQWSTTPVETAGDSDVGILTSDTMAVR